MYSEFIIRPAALADKFIYPDTARKLVAEACDGLQLPPVLFNRQADGKTLQGKYWHEDKNHIEAGLPLPPVVSYDGGKGFLKVLMFGEPGRDLMAETAAHIATAVGRHVGGAYSFMMNEGDCNIQPRSTPVLYSIRRLVASKKPEGSRQYIKTDPADVSDNLRRIILRGLISQARWMDDNGTSGLYESVPHEDSLGFHIAEGRSIPIEIKEGKLAAGYAGLTFTMNLMLVGPWFAGHLRSRGYGQIRPRVLEWGDHDE